MEVVSNIEEEPQEEPQSSVEVAHADDNEYGENEAVTARRNKQISKYSIHYDEADEPEWTTYDKCRTRFCLFLIVLSIAGTLALSWWFFAVVVERQSQPAPTPVEDGAPSSAPTASP